MILECALLKLNLLGSIMSIAHVPHGDCTSKDFCCPFDTNEGIEYHFYNDRLPHGIKIFNGDIPLLQQKLGPFNVNKSLPLVIYLHGYGDHYFSSPGKAILQAYLQRKNHNIVLVDWSSLCSVPWYITAVRNTPMSADHIVRFIQKLEELKYNIDKIHLIGFSLGAQLAGFVGKQLRNEDGSPRLKRITGLDPAYPLYYFATDKQRLDKNDAEFVDVIHTNYGFVGVLENIGDADYYVNEIWKNQPGCSAAEIWQRQPIVVDDFLGCNHHAAWRYYCNTVENPDLYKAKKCNGSVVSPVCEESVENIPMGWNADPKKIGIFLVKTNRTESNKL